MYFSIQPDLLVFPIIICINLNFKLTTHASERIIPSRKSRQVKQRYHSFIFGKPRFLLPFFFLIIQLDRSSFYYSCRGLALQLMCLDNLFNRDLSGPYICLSLYKMCGYIFHSRSLFLSQRKISKLKLINTSCFHITK